MQIVQFGSFYDYHLALLVLLRPGKEQQHCYGGPDRLSSQNIHIRVSVAETQDGRQGYSERHQTVGQPVHI